MTEPLILTSVSGPVATIWLNRPDKHNALNGEMISGLLTSLQDINEMDNVRAIILRGKGHSFCAGADLNWMLESRHLSENENFRECEALATCFYQFYHCRAITVCLIHGSSMGGANGLVSACDISIANVNATFGFPEVHAGLLPATVAPYIIHRTGSSRALELMLTGRKFSAIEALQLGLIHHLVTPENSEDFLDQQTRNILKGSPVVQRQIKAMLLDKVKLSAGESVIYDTALMLAQSRISPEAGEGISAFKQKRKPEWYKELK